MLPGWSERYPRSRRQLDPEPLLPQLLHQIAQAAGPAVVAVAELVEELRHGAADLDRMLGMNEDVDVRREARSIGEPATDQQVEPDRPVVEPGRDESQIVDLRLGAVLAAAGDAHLELARQIGVLAVTGEEIADGHRDWVGVDDLFAVDPGDRAAEHVARRVAAGLNGRDTDRFKLAPDLRHRADPDPVQLDVLPRGQVEVAVAPERVRLRATGVLRGALADEPGLRRGEPPAGDLHPQHEGIAALSLRVEPDPLQPLRLTLNAQDRGRSLQRVAIQYRLLDLERVPSRFPALDLIQLRL